MQCEILDLDVVYRFSRFIYDVRYSYVLSFGSQIQNVIHNEEAVEWN